MNTPEIGHDVPAPRGSSPAPGSLYGLPLLAFGLIPGPRELFLVVVVALVLYGRSGSRVLIASRRGQPPSPGVRMLRRVLGLPVDPRPRRGATPRAEPAATTGGSSRLFWALTLIAAVAVAALVVTRALIHSAVTSPH
jgi:hypothetical protein